MLNIYQAVDLSDIRYLGRDYMIRTSDVLFFGSIILHILCLFLLFFLPEEVLTARENMVVYKAERKAERDRECAG